LGNCTVDMPKTLIEVTRDAAELPAPERLKLARILLDLSEANAEPMEEVEAAWDAEIARRAAELRSGDVKGVSLETVKRKIESRFRP
jgi:putative addiction module component (TIGR02574 family)